MAKCIKGGGEPPRWSKEEAQADLSHIRMSQVYRILVIEPGMFRSRAKILKHAFFFVINTSAVINTSTKHELFFLIVVVFEA